MICKKPFHNFGCGQCLPCRINKRRLWSHRLILEQKKHAEACFVTLTYSDENLPPGGSLSKVDYQKWLKRLRKIKSIRYFLVGEYGDQTQRPHYHAAIYGHAPCLYAPGPTQEDQFHRRTCDCSSCIVIRKTWGLGLTDCASLSLDSAQYIAGYVTKKMTNPNDEVTKEFLNGRYPEFARMSKKPGIGAPAMADIVDALCSDSGATLLLTEGDVPSTLMHGGRKWPLGRYLRSKMRELYGFEKTGTPKEVLFELSKKTALELEEDIEKEIQTKKRVRYERKKQKILNIEAKYKLFNKKGNL